MMTEVLMQEFEAIWAMARILFCVNVIFFVFNMYYTRRRVRKLKEYMENKR